MNPPNLRSATALLCILAIVALGAGLGCGRWLASGVRGGESAAVASARLGKSADAAALVEGSETRAFSTDEEMLTAIMSAVAEEEPLRRAHQLQGLLGRLGEAELAALFARSVRLEDYERRELLLSALLGRWAALDPAAATAAARPFRDRFRATARADWRGVDQAVYAAWTQAQPEAALAEAVAAPDASWAHSTVFNALAVLARGDPKAKLALLADLPAGRLRDAVSQHEIRSLAETDSAAAEAGIALLTEPRLRARMQAEVLGKLAARDPAAALARLAAAAPGLTGGREGVRLVTAVLKAAATQDPAAALAAVGDLPEDLQTQGRGAALVGWAEKQPSAALEWAAAHGVDVAGTRAMVDHGSEEFLGWNSLVGIALEKDRVATLAWLRTQPASVVRDGMLREALWRGTGEERLAAYAELTPVGRAGAIGSVVEAIYAEEPQRAEALVKAQPPGAARQSAISSLASVQAVRVPEERSAVAEAWPVGPDRDAALRGLSWGLYNDAPQALTLVRRISDPALREATFERVAESWSYRDAPAARAWLATTTDLSPNQKRALLREWDER